MKRNLRWSIAAKAKPRRGIAGAKLSRRCLAG
jgi:hypothetical protein